MQAHVEKHMLKTYKRKQRKPTNNFPTITKSQNKNEKQTKKYNNKTSQN